jgi:hypothetical protein
MKLSNLAVLIGLTLSAQALAGDEPAPAPAPDPVPVAEPAPAPAPLEVIAPRVTAPATEDDGWGSNPWNLPPDMLERMQNRAPAADKLPRQ